MRIEEWSKNLFLILVGVVLFIPCHAQELWSGYDEAAVEKQFVNDSVSQLVVQLEPAGTPDEFAEDIYEKAPLSPGQYKVKSGDTLWNIARRLRFDGISVVQTMEAIFRYNSSAFDGDDVSSLKIGSMIWLPTGDEVRLEFGTFISPGIERIDPDRIQTQALLSSIDRSATDGEMEDMLGEGRIPQTSSDSAESKVEPPASKKAGSVAVDLKSESTDARRLSIDTSVQKLELTAQQLGNEEIQVYSGEQKNEFPDEYELISSSKIDIEKPPIDSQVEPPLNLKLICKYIQQYLRIRICIEVTKIYLGDIPSQAIGVCKVSIVRHTDTIG